MSLTHNRYADYLLAPIPERFNPPVLRSIKIAPAKAGDAIPDFSLQRANFITDGPLLPESAERAPLRELLNRPLVLAFVSQHWNNYAHTLLQDLRDIYQDIHVMGGQLLVISDEDKAWFTPLLEQYQLSFPVLWDNQHKIAGRFGLYSDTDPIWDRISGIDADVPSPGIYVLSPSGKIVFESVDLYFEKSLPVRQLLSAVYDARQEQAA
jgi:peroxiredoxin